MFRKNTIKFLLTLLLCPFMLIAQGYKIEVTVHNSLDSIAYLGHYFSTKRYLDDTVKIVNGKAIFSKNKKLTEGIYFYYTTTTYFEFLIEDQQFSLETSTPNFVKNMKIKNSPINNGFYKLQKYTAKKTIESKALKKKYDSVATQPEKKRIAFQLKQLNKEVENYQNDLKLTYKNTFFEKLIVLMQPPPKPIISDKKNNSPLFTYHYYKNNFWNSINITDPGLLRTPILHDRINDYLDNVIIQQSDSVIKEVDQLIAKSSGSKEAFRYVLITLVNKYESSPVIDFDKVFVHLIEKYYLTGQADAWANKETLDKLKKRVDMIKPNFLEKNAPELILWDTLGNKINLRDIDATFTILYFYDPDCGHCKKSTPILYQSYPNLVAKGIEILAICTATDEKKWKDFIIKEDLNWINLADLESKTHVKYYYDIQSIPTIYILDKDKKIILKKISAEKIPQIMDTLIKQKEN